MASAGTGSRGTTANAEQAPVSSQRVRRPAWRSAVGTVSIAVALTACTATHEGQGHRLGSSPAASPSSTPSPSDPARPSCPASYLPPRPDRPRVVLTFAVAPDLATVRGTERITFTPDRPITELVFRLTANTAPTVARATRSSSPRPRRPRCGEADLLGGRRRAVDAGRPAAHPVPGDLWLPAPTVTADLTFTLTLGAGPSTGSAARRSGGGSPGSARPSRCSPGSAATAGTPSR